MNGTGYSRDELRAEAVRRGLIAPTSPQVAAGRGALDGATFGFYDEARGLVADILPGGLNGAQARADERRLHDQARLDRPGSYLAGQIGGGVATGLAVPGSGILRGAQVAKAAATGAKTAANAAKSAGFLRSTGAALAKGLNAAPRNAGLGAVYGGLSAAGGARGGIAERLPSAVQGAGAGAAFGAAAPLAAAPFVGAISRGGQALTRANAQRQAALAGREAANSAVDVAQHEALRETIGQSGLPGLADAFRRAEQAGGERAVQEAAGFAGASQTRALGKQFGLDLTRSQVLADKEGRRWLYQAQAGVHGDHARDVAEGIIRQQREAAPAAFARTLDQPVPLRDSHEGAQQLQAGLRQREADLNLLQSPAWDRFEAEYARTPLAASNKKSGGGISALTKQLNQRLFANPAVENQKLRSKLAIERGLSGLDLERAVREEGQFAAGLADQAGVPLWESASPAIRVQARQAYPQTRRVHGFLGELQAHYAATEGRARPGSQGALADIIALRRLAQSAYQETLPGSQDRRGVSVVMRGIDDWLEQNGDSMLRSGRKTGAADEAIGAFREAAATTRTHRQTFRDDDLIAGIIDPSQDSERALSKLIGTRGVRPQAGAWKSVQRLKATFGEQSPEVQTLKSTVMARLSDTVSTANVRENPKAFAQIANEVDDLLSKHSEFTSALFSPTELEKLKKLQIVLRALREPGPDAANPSGSVTQALLPALKGALGAVPGVGIIGDAARRHIAVPLRARAELRDLPLPGRIVETARGAGAGFLQGPQENSQLARAINPILAGPGQNALAQQETERQRRAALLELGYRP